MFPIYCTCRAVGNAVLGMQLRTFSNAHACFGECEGFVCVLSCGLWKALVYGFETLRIAEAAEWQQKERVIASAAKQSPGASCLYSTKTDP